MSNGKTLVIAERVAIGVALFAIAANGLMLLVVYGFTAADPPAERLRLRLIFAAPIVCAATALASAFWRWSRVLTITCAMFSFAAAVIVWMS